ncbi:MAG: GTP-binding protein [Clostridiales bacterium]|nr:GTP-binding protein [Candidatus Coliplasma caballi]
MTKIDIFSGFLGAGKTTLIKKLIAEAYAGEKLVLIENEFGEIGIDGGFLKEAGIEITEMNSGCICCSLVGDFGEALKKVLAEFAPDRILIEPSGVGKLSDVIRAVRNIETPDAVLNGFATVVDAGKCKMYMKNFGEFFNDQVSHANTVILSHTDGCSEEKLQKCVAMLRENNPDATIVSTSWEQIDGKLILDAMEQKNTMEIALAKLAAETEHLHDDDDEDEEHEHHHHHDHEDHECHHHHHDHDDDDDDEDEEHEHHHHGDDDEDEHEHHHDGCGCGCGHDHHHHHHADEVFTSWGVETTRTYGADELQSILSELMKDTEYGMILRAKGIVAGKDGKWIHFDYVPGEPDVRNGAADIIGRLCVIGSGIHEDKLAELFGVNA